MPHKMPTTPLLCDVCGKELGESYWVHDFDKFVHTRCRPWHEVPWPFDDCTKDLRKLYKRTASSNLREHIAETARWLRHHKQRWPHNATDVVIATRDRMR